MPLTFGVLLANTIVAVLKICDTILSTVWLVISRKIKINKIHQQKTSKQQRPIKSNIAASATGAFYRSFGAIS